MKMKNFITMDFKKQLKQLTKLLDNKVSVQLSETTLLKEEEKAFVEIIEKLKQLVSKADRVAQQTGIILFDHDEEFFVLIEFLLDQLYGRENSEIIMWWVYYKSHDLKNIEVEFLDEEDEELNNEFKDIDTIQDLFKIIKGKKK
jgi:exoribonuclease II